MNTINTRRPPNPYTDPHHGLYAPCKPVDFIAAVLTMGLVAAILLGALDGMLMQLTTRIDAPVQIEESPLTGTEQHPR